MLVTHILKEARIPRSQMVLYRTAPYFAQIETEKLITQFTKEALPKFKQDLTNELVGFSFTDFHDKIVKINAVKFPANNKLQMNSQEHPQKNGKKDVVDVYSYGNITIEFDNGTSLDISCYVASDHEFAFLPNSENKIMFEFLFRSIFSLRGRNGKVLLRANLEHNDDEEQPFTKSSISGKDFKPASFSSVKTTKRVAAIYTHMQALIVQDTKGFTPEQKIKFANMRKQRKNLNDASRRRFYELSHKHNIAKIDKGISPPHPNYQGRSKEIDHEA